MSNKKPITTGVRCTSKKKPSNKFLKEELCKEFETTDKLKEDELKFKEFEPKTSNRSLVTITDKKGNTVVPSFLIKSTNRPSFYLTDSGIFVPNCFRISCYDPIKPSVPKTLMKYLRNKDTVWDLNLRILSPNGKTVEEWQLNDAKLSDVDFSGFDWSDDCEPSYITLEFQLEFKNIKLKK